MRKIDRKYIYSDEYEDKDIFKVYDSDLESNSSPTSSFKSGNSLSTNYQMYKSKLMNLKRPICGIIFLIFKEIFSFSEISFDKICNIPITIRLNSLYQ